VGVFFVLLEPELINGDIECGTRYFWVVR